MRPRQFGVAAVQVGVSYAPDASAFRPTRTMPAPTAWRNASPATPGRWLVLDTAAEHGGGRRRLPGDGLYRLYTRPADEVGNTVTRTTSLFRAAFIADGTPPSVTLITPTASLVTSAPAVALEAAASDTIPVGGVSQNNLARVYFSVDGAAVTATQTLGPNPTARPSPSPTARTPSRPSPWTAPATSAAARQPRSASRRRATRRR
ncbi:MAG: hypothetical protein U0641_03425 [Anaerolineae bacterium]